MSYRNLSGGNNVSFTGPKFLCDVIKAKNVIFGPEQFSGVLRHTHPLDLALGNSFILRQMPDSLFETRLQGIMIVVFWAVRQVSNMSLA